MKSLFFLLLLGVSFSLPAQHLSFASASGTRDAGHLEVWRQCQEGDCTYSLHGVLSGDDSPVSLTLTSHYRDAQLSSAVMRRQEADVQTESAGIRWSDAGYQFMQQGSLSSIGRKPLNNSLITLFFQEPRGQRRVFLEADGLETPLYQVAPHTYEFFRPNGERYRFLYDMGICTGVLIENEKGTFPFLLQSAHGSSSGLME